MKILLLVLALTLTACGVDNKEPRQTHFEATLPAQYAGDSIVTEGTYLGYSECNETWPTSVPYNIDTQGVFRSGENAFKPVQDKERTWAYRRDHDDYVGVTTFRLLDDSILITLDCRAKPQPISEAL